MDKAVSLAVPLEHQLSVKFPSVLTPSGQVSDMAAIAGVELPAAEAVAEYLGAPRRLRALLLAPGAQLGPGAAHKRVRSVATLL